MPSRRAQRCIDCHAYYKKYDPWKGVEVNACRWGRMSEGDPHYADPTLEMDCGGYFQPFEGSDKK